MPRKETTDAAAADSPARRRGPKPLLSMETEVQVAHWVLAKQSAGQRVSRDDVIAQAQEMLRQNKNSSQDQKPSQTVGMGWCNRFIARHPELSLRSGSAAAVQNAAPATNEDSTVKFAINDATLPVLEQKEENSDDPEATKQSEATHDAEEGPAKTRKYNRKHMDAAVEMYLAGRPMSEVTQRFPLLHQRTIRRRVLRVQRGEVDKRRGPRPLLEGEPEQELVTWILAMQSQGTTVTKKDILARANEYYYALTGETGEKLKDGWLQTVRKEENFGTEEEKVAFKEENDSTDVQELLSAVEEKRLKRESVAEDLTLPKRLKTEGNVSTCSSDNTRLGSIFPGRQQSDKDESMAKLDAIMESNKRLEAMQRQQLEMLQQLCASNNMLTSISLGKRNIYDK
ncbi:hypothetical protein PInf_008502 [Phytophthora infestans]|nr:hypothetical protein PInf_008502 [Phytophthora infestans]